MRRTIVATIVAAVLGSIVFADDAPPASLLGFGQTAAAEQRILEKRFDALLSRDNLRAWMQRLAQHPHSVGSVHGRRNAEFIAEQFRSWGYETAIEKFEVLFPTPLRRELELVEPGGYRARLSEPPLEEDASTRRTEGWLPPYNAYSIDGEVTGLLVYVNYGVPADYEVLKRHGIDVEGKIVLARYGGSWRGIKPKVAAEHGAVGCILYSDPRDDGYYQGDVYPRGAFRSAHGAQRGSVADMPLYPGDPLTPGVGATADAERLSIDESPTLTRIPVLPISYADAQPLLEALGGPVAPAEWRGALPLTYHLGPGPAVVRLALQFDWSLVTAYDVIAKLEGAERPDEWILRGNHHDAWVLGASDPISGLVAMMEEARAIGALAADGWRPRRTLIYAAWDAEEPGLIGSTEWVETHAELLEQRAVVYVNTDSNGRGFLSAGGSHTLESFFNEVAQDVLDPQKGISVAERARARRMLEGTTEEQREADEGAGMRLDALGSGSDFTPFLQHLGVASIHVGFWGENAGGSYHSLYDSFDHYLRFGDPEFDYGVALAQTAGRVVLRLSEAELLPFEFRELAETLGRYIEEITELTDEMRSDTERTNRLIVERVHQAVADPRKPFTPPEPQDPVPHMNFAPLQNAQELLKASAIRYAAALATLDADGTALTTEQRRELDRILFTAERYLTWEQGLPRRPWFRHQVYAPGFYTGYGVKTLPGVREAVEEREWGEAESQIRILAGILERYTTRIDAARAILAGAASDDPQGQMPVLSPAESAPQLPAKGVSGRTR